jgi:hypothetical protein
MKGELEEIKRLLLSKNRTPKRHKTKRRNQGKSELLRNTSILGQAFSRGSCQESWRPN